MDAKAKTLLASLLAALFVLTALSVYEHNDGPAVALPWMKKNAVEMKKHANNVPAVAGSRMGGLPAMKPGSKWPIGPKGPLSFLFQVNLEEAAGFDTDKLLPDKGLLLFFYENEDQVWGFDPKDRGNWQVIYYPDTAGLQKVKKTGTTIFKELPVDFISAYKYRGYSLSSDEGQTHDTIPQLDGDGKQGGGIGNNNYLLGHPSPIQDPDMEEECQLASNGIYVGDTYDEKSPEVRKLLAGAREWVLLAQLDSNDDADMMWGDTGRLYFWIKEADLKNRDFSKVWMVLQCY